MPLIFQHRIYRSDLQKNPDVLYIFGDNLKRVGYGGQAAHMRDEPNAVGIATKKSPGMSDSDFFSDNELKDNIASINKDFERVVKHIQMGGIVVFPSDGIGTGLSELPKRAPMTARFIDGCVNVLKNYKDRL
jgi:hypothetical protein